MAISGGPGEQVQSPACVPARYGLLSVAEVEDRADGHWLQGFHHEQVSCDDIDSRVLECPPDNEEKDTESGLEFPESDPFTLIAPFKCAVPGGMPLSRAWDLAEQRLDQAENRALERLFWTGRDRLGNVVRGTLGGDTAEDITPAAGAVSLTDGFALLESWAGENMSCAPILHASRGLGVYLAERNLVEASGNGSILYSKGTGSRIAIGGGYRVTGPDGVAAPAGEGWLFVTGAIRVLRGPKFFTPNRGDDAGAVDRLINDITVFAERNYGVERECGLAAIRVSLKSCCC